MVAKDPHSALKILEQPEQSAVQGQAISSISNTHDSIIAKTIELAKLRAARMEHPLSGALFNEPVLNV